MTNVTQLQRPKRRRRQRCEFCNELYHPEPDMAMRNVCSVCRPALFEVVNLEHGNELAGPWREYQAVIPSLARGKANLVLKDRTATRFHAGWRLLDEQGRQVVGAEIKRLSVQNRRQSMKVVEAGA